MTAPIPLPVPQIAGQFDTFEQWVDRATARLAYRTDSNGWAGQAGLPAICVDTKGRRCSNGKDFMRARDEGTFPVRYFWHCCPDESPDPNDR